MNTEPEQKSEPTSPEATGSADRDDTQTETVVLLDLGNYDSPYD